MRFPDRAVIGHVSIDGAGEFDIVMERVPPKAPADLAVPPDIAERVHRFETGRNGEDDTLYRAATDRTILVGVVNRLNALRAVSQTLIVDEEDEAP